MTIYSEAKDKLVNDYGSEMFLGRIVWYTVSETLAISHKKFHEVALDNFMGLSTQPILPGYPRPTDVFKRACTAAQIKNVRPLGWSPAGGEDEDIVYNYMVRPSGHDSDHVWRTIVRETVNSTGHALDYTELVRVTFNRETEKLRFNNIDTSEVNDPNVNAVVESITGYFKGQDDQITPYAVREFTRKFLEKQLHAIKVRPSGGVYFVSETQAEALEALDRTLNTIGAGASFHFHPLVDTSKEREMLRLAFEEESIGEVDRLIGEMVEIVTGDTKISTDRFANLKVEYDNLREKTQSYASLLDDSMNGTSGRLDIMEQVLIELIGHVKG